MHVAHVAHDAGGAVGAGLGQPFAEERRDLPRPRRRTDRRFNELYQAIWEGLSA